MASFFRAGYAEGRARAKLAQAAEIRKEREEGRKDAKLGIAKEELGIKKDYLKIAQEDLGIRLEDLDIRKGMFAMSAEKHGWQKQMFEWTKADKEKEMEIQQGLVKAVQAGGYGSGIDFLKVVDPDRAIKFHAEKLKLDNSIMQNDVLKVASKNEINKAMFESYGLMGKMGYSIMNAPKDQQAQMYQQILPMIKKINPNAPNKFNASAQGMLMLGMAQGTPANLLYGAQNDALTANTQIAKTAADLRNRIARGMTSENSQEVRALQAQMKKYENDALKAGFQKMKAEFDMVKSMRDPQQKQAKFTESLNKNLLANSSGFTKAMENYSQAKPLIKILTSKPNSAEGIYAANGLARIYAKAMNSGALSEQDVQVGFTSAGYGWLFKKGLSMIKGEQVPLNARERKGIALVFEAMMKSKLDTQLSVESRFKNSALEYGNVLNQKALRFPSQQYFALQGDKQAIEQTSEQGQQDIPTFNVETGKFE